MRRDFIGRCGASSLAEISYYGLPSVLIPYPYGSHQRENGLYFQKRGAAFLFEEKAFSAHDFKVCLDSLINDKSARKSMAEAASAINLGVMCEKFSASFVF